MENKNEEFFLVVKNGEFFVDWFCNEKREAFFPLFGLETQQQEKQLARKLFYPKSARFPLRHYTDRERANFLASKTLSDDLVIPWMDNALLLDPHDFNSRTKYGSLQKALVILEGCFFH